MYKRHISYGTVVQLCVSRNKLRKSSQRYKAVAKIKTRRARKGFSLRFNRDAHWSASFYNTLMDEVSLISIETMLLASASTH